MAPWRGGALDHSGAGRRAAVFLGPVSASREPFRGPAESPSEGYCRDPPEGSALPRASVPTRPERLDHDGGLPSQCARSIRPLATCTAGERGPPEQVLGSSSGGTDKDHVRQHKREQLVQRGGTTAGPHVSAPMRTSASTTPRARPGPRQRTPDPTASDLPRCIRSSGLRGPRLGAHGLHSERGELRQGGCASRAQARRERARTRPAAARTPHPTSSASARCMSDSSRSARMPDEGLHGQRTGSRPTRTRSRGNYRPERRASTPTDEGCG